MLEEGSTPRPSVELDMADVFFIDSLGLTCRPNRANWSVASATNCHSSPVTAPPPCVR
jgi:hypothetical protein